MLENALTTTSTRCSWSSLAPPRAHIRLLQRSLCKFVLSFMESAPHNLQCTDSAFKTHVLAHLLKIRSTVMMRTSVVTMTVVEEVQKVLTLAGGPIMTRL